MKLLFDENLSPRLPRALADLYPDSAHVHECGLGATDDSTIWQYAQEHGFTVVSKDSDFQDRSILGGHPPKFIWIRAENCTTSEIENLLRTAESIISQFVRQAQDSYLVLGSRRKPGSSRGNK